jgi:hypothetical protein
VPRTESAPVRRGGARRSARECPQRRGESPEAGWASAARADLGAAARAALSDR